MAFPVRWFSAICMLTKAYAVEIIDMHHRFFGITHGSCVVDVDETCVRSGMPPCGITIRNLVDHAKDEYVALVATHFATAPRQHLGLYRGGNLVPGLERNPARNGSVFEWPVQQLDRVLWKGSGALRTDPDGKVGWKLCLRTRKIVFDIHNEGDAKCLVENGQMCVEPRKSGGWSCVFRIIGLPNHDRSVQDVTISSRLTVPGILNIFREGVQIGSPYWYYLPWPILVGDKLKWHASSAMNSWKACLEVEVREKMLHIENEGSAPCMVKNKPWCVEMWNAESSGRCVVRVLKVHTYDKLRDIHAIVTAGSVAISRNGVPIAQFSQSEWSDWPVLKGDKVELSNATTKGSVCLEYRPRVFYIKNEGAVRCVVNENRLCVHGWSDSSGSCVVEVNLFPPHNTNEVFTLSNQVISGNVTVIRDGMPFGLVEWGDLPLLEGDKLEWQASDATMQWSFCIRRSVIKTKPKGEMFTIENTDASCTVDPHFEFCVRLRNFADSQQCQVTIRQNLFDEQVFATPYAPGEGGGVLGLYRDGNLVQGIDSNPAGMDTNFWWPVKVGDKFNWTNANQSDREGAVRPWTICVAPYRPLTTFFLKESGPCAADPQEPMCIDRHHGNTKCVMRITRLPARSPEELVVLRPVYFDNVGKLRLIRQGRDVEVSGMNKIFEWPTIVGDTLEWASSGDHSQYYGKMCLRAVLPCPTEQ